MKKYILIAGCLMAATSVFAQKRELRKIESAVESGNLDEAQEIFATINEAEVEEKYKAQYLFYKSASVSGVIDKKKTTYEEIKEAEGYLMEAEKMGYKDENFVPMVKRGITSRKIEIANDKLVAGDTEGGLLIIDDIYKSDTSNKDMLFSSAQISYQTQDYDAAREKYQELFDLGYTGQKTNYYATNIATGEEESFLNRKIMDVSVSRVKSHSSPREEVTPSNMGVLVNNLVWLYKQDEQMSKAKFTFDTALERFPDDESLEMAKPEIYNNLDMMDEYKASVEKINDSVTDPLVYDNLANAAFKAKNYEQAIQYYESSLELEPDNFASQVNLANCYLEMGNMENVTYDEQKERYLQAIDHLEKGHEIKPDDVGVMNTLISLYGVYEMTDKIEAIKAKM
jgi:tetratricopeptide (TPR) repeat protein